MEDVSEATHLIPAQRRERIVRFVRQEQVLSVAQLTERLGVSHMTVRRDIAALARQGRVMPVAGGVSLPYQLRAEPARTIKAEQNLELKDAIAREAARLIKPEMMIYLDAGTTTQAMVEQIVAIPGISVITNDFAIVAQLSSSGLETIHIGGHVEHQNASTSGNLATLVLAQVNIDIAFISTPSWSTRHGVTIPAEQKVTVKRAAMAASSESVLLADSSKYGTFSAYRVASVAQFDRIVTDERLPDAARAAVRDLDVELVLATVDQGQQPASTVLPSALPEQRSAPR